MTINWSRELGTIAALVIVSIILLLVMKKTKSIKHPEQNIQSYNKKSGEYFLSMYTAVFFGVSIVIDTIALFNHSCEFNLSGHYLFPLLIASIIYMKTKYVY